MLPLLLILYFFNAGGCCHRKYIIRYLTHIYFLFAHLHSQTYLLYYSSVCRLFLAATFPFFILFDVLFYFLCTSWKVCSCSHEKSSFCSANPAICGSLRPRWPHQRIFIGFFLTQKRLYAWILRSRLLWSSVPEEWFVKHE